MTDRIERDARLLCEVDGHDPDALEITFNLPHRCPRWQLEQYLEPARRLSAAGLTLARIEPDEATVERVARAIESFGMDVAEIVEEDEPDRATDIRDEIFAKARAAYRAAVEEG